MGCKRVQTGATQIFAKIWKAPEFVSSIKTLMDCEVTPLLGSVSGVNLDEYNWDNSQFDSGPICLDS
jgi:protein gp37